MVVLDSIGWYLFERLLVGGGFRGYWWVGVLEVLGKLLAKQGRISRNERGGVRGWEIYYRIEG